MQTLQLQQKANRLTNQDRITRLLGWTEMDYSQFIYETGLQYLESYIPTDRAGIDALSRSKIFWAWWRNHWAIRDENYLEVLENFSLDNWEILYRQLHDIDALINSIYPSAVVLHNSYAVMIDHFNKSVV